MNNLLTPKVQERNNFANQNPQKFILKEQDFSESHQFNMKSNINFKHEEDNEYQHTKQSHKKSSMNLTKDLKEFQNNDQTSSSNNFNSQVENNKCIASSQQPQSISSQSELTINYSPSQIEKIDTLHIAFSRQISEKQCQQFKMHSDFDDFSQATPISAPISSSNNKGGKTITDDEDEEVVKNIFKDLNNIETNNRFDNYINNQQIDKEDNNYFDESEDDEEQKIQSKNNQKFILQGTNQKKQNINTNNHMNIQKINNDEYEEYYGSNDQSLEGDEEIDYKYKNKQKFQKNKNYPFSKKQVERFKEEENKINNLNKDSVNQEDKNQIQQPIQFQNKQQQKENNPKISNQNYSSSNISSSNDLQDQFSQQLKIEQAGESKKIIINKEKDSQLKIIQINQNNFNQTTSIASQQTIENDQKKMKLDLVQRMQQFKGELKNDIEQAHNELLKLKTQKSIKLQDYSECSSQNDFSQKQNAHDSTNNSKQNTHSIVNNLKQSQNEIEQNSIIEIATESQSDNMNRGDIAQSNNNFPYSKYSEISINAKTHNTVRQETSSNIKQQQTLSPSSVNSSVGNFFLSFKDNYSSLYYEQNNDHQNLSENQSQEQNKKTKNVEDRIKKYNNPDHIDQLQFLEQEKIKLQQLIFEKEKKLKLQQETNSSQNIIQTIQPPSRDNSFFSNSSEQFKQNEISTNLLDKLSQNILDQNQQNNQQQLKKIQSFKEQNITSQVQQESSSKKKDLNIQKNNQKKQQKQKPVKNVSQQQEESNQNNKIDKLKKNLTSRNISNPRIQEQIQNKTDGLAAEGIQMIKQLDQKFSLQLQDIHYKHHQKMQKLTDQIKQLEQENNYMRKELEQRSVAAKELKESEARMIDLASNIQDVQIGKLISQELEVNSLEEVYTKIKNTYKNCKQEKKFISCILDMVNRCNPQLIQNSKQNINSTNSSQNLQQIQNNSQLNSQIHSGDSRLQQKENDQSSQQQQEQTNLKIAWKWLKFIIEDYVNLKSKNTYQIGNVHGKFDKNNQMYKSCVVENQTLQKQNQMDTIQPLSLSLVSDTVVLQEINILLNTENKYESLKCIKEILNQNELYRQQINLIKTEPKQLSSITPQQISVSTKRVNTQGSTSSAYNIQKDLLNQSIPQQSLYFHNQQQQSRLLSPTSSQQNNSQNFKQSSKNSVFSNNVSQCGFPNNFNINNNFNSHNDINGGMQKHLMRKISPQKNNCDDSQSENDQNRLNCAQNNNIIQMKQNQLIQNYSNNLKISGNQNKCTSPSKIYQQNNIKQESMSILNISPRENNCIYNNNNSCVQFINSHSSQYTKTKINQYFNGNPYLQISEKQSTKQY